LNATAQPRASAEADFERVLDHHPHNTPYRLAASAAGASVVVEVLPHRLGWSHHDRVVVVWHHCRKIVKKKKNKSLDRPSPRLGRWLAVVPGIPSRSGRDRANGVWTSIAPAARCQTVGLRSHRARRRTPLPVAGALNRPSRHDEVRRHLSVGRKPRLRPRGSARSSHPPGRALRDRVVATGKTVAIPRRRKGKTAIGFGHPCAQRGWDREGSRGRAPPASHSPARLTVHGDWPDSENTIWQRWVVQRRPRGDGQPGTAPGFSPPTPARFTPTSVMFASAAEPPMCLSGPQGACTRRKPSRPRSPSQPGTVQRSRRPQWLHGIDGSLAPILPSPATPHAGIPHRLGIAGCTPRPNSRIALGEEATAPAVRLGP